MVAISSSVDKFRKNEDSSYVMYRCFCVSLLSSKLLVSFFLFFLTGIPPILFIANWFILYLGYLLKKFNELVNIELKCLGRWLNADKIPLNVKRTEMVKNKVLSGKRIYPTENIKYLAVKIDENFTFF